MSRTRRHLLMVLVMIVAYSAIALSPGIRNDHEVLPFFRWSLFSRVPERERTSFAVRFVEIDGDPVAEPEYFEESAHIFSRARSPQALDLQQRWGEAVVEGDDVAAEEARHLFEARFLNGISSGRYELVERRYDVLDRFSCRCYLDETPVAEHRYG